jgi:hypothetical protein
MSQAHYDYIDFSITVGSEAGTKESSVQIRTWMKHLSEFIHALDFIHAQPLTDWIEQKPAHLVAAALVRPGKEYVAYLADSREVTDQSAGEPIAGSLTLRLPAGEYLASLYSPTTGGESPAVKLRGGGETITLELVPFRHDVVVRVRRAE